MIPNKATDLAVPPASLQTRIRAIRENDESVIRQVYAEYYRSAEKYILENSGTCEEAKDIYQEAFIAVWQNIRLHRFEAQNEGSLKSYLLQIVRNKWLDYLRSSKYKNTVALSDDDRMGEELFDNNSDDHQKLQMIKVHFMNLGDTCKEVLKRFYYKKESLRTISAVFNWTEATARNNKYRCIQRLKEAFLNK